MILLLLLLLLLLQQLLLLLIAASFQVCKSFKLLQAWQDAARQTPKASNSEGITTTYKKASTDTANIIDSQAKSITQELNIDNRTEQIAKQQLFSTLKDHKDNFANHPTCRLINPAKTELGKVSKQILDNINSKVREMTKLN